MASSTASAIHVFPLFCNARKSALPGPANITGNNFNMEIYLLAKHAYTCGDNIVEECHFGTRWDYKYKSLSWDIVDTVLLSETNFPYPLERAKWDGLEKILENKDALIKQILEFAGTMQNVTPPLQDDDTVLVSLRIVKKVYVSPQEFELIKARIISKHYEDIAQILWKKICDVINGLGRDGSSLYEELQWLEGHIENIVRETPYNWRMYFDENYERELLRTLTEQARREFTSLPAVRSIMQSLQKVNLPEDESIDKCPICMESYSPSSEPYSMPCSHSFHYGCIETWLLKNSSCPMCRYKLPPTESK